MGENDESTSGWFFGCQSLYKGVEVWSVKEEEVTFRARGWWLGLYHWVHVLRIGVGQWLTMIFCAELLDAPEGWIKGGCLAIWGLYGNLMVVMIEYTSDGQMLWVDMCLWSQMIVTLCKQQAYLCRKSSYQKRQSTFLAIVWGWLVHYAAYGRFLVF